VVRTTTVVALVFTACDNNAPSPPTQSAVAVLAHTPSDAPIAAIAPRAKAVLASWSSHPPAAKYPASPRCIVSPRRFIQYADLDAQGSPRFCLWSSPDLPTALTGCWRVELATGAYVAETGVWFSAPQPLRDDPRGPVRLGNMTIHPDGRVVVAGDPPRTIHPPPCAR